MCRKIGALFKILSVAGMYLACIIVQNICIRILTILKPLNDTFSAELREVALIFYFDMCQIISKL